MFSSVQWTPKQERPELAESRLPPPMSCAVSTFPANFAGALRSAEGKACTGDARGRPGKSTKLACEDERLWLRVAVFVL